MNIQITVVSPYLTRIASPNKEEIVQFCNVLFGKGNWSANGKTCCWWELGGRITLAVFDSDMITLIQEEWIKPIEKLQQEFVPVAQ